METAGFAVFDGTGGLPERLRGGVVAIGNFDGCHRGHQRVLATTLEMARAKGAPALMLTFEPHPRDVFAPAPHTYRLTGVEEKAMIARALGLDALVVLTFDRMLASLSPQEFIARHLVADLGVSGVAVGADFHFGKGRAGTPELLAAEGEALGFETAFVSILGAGDEPVSSTRIREALAAGAVAEANGMLGYHHFLTGAVEPGDRRGRELGYPTANIAVPSTARLRHGIYAVRCRVGAKVHDGVAAFGKPMFGDDPPPFETHIFDFDRDIYGQTLSVALLGFLRGQEKFDGLDALVAQMDRDSEQARIITARAAPLSELDAALGFVVG